MTMLSESLLKLDEVRTYIESQADDLTNPDHKTWTKDLYSKLINDLIDGLNIYCNDKFKKEDLLKKIIISMNHAMNYELMEEPDIVFQSISGTQLGHENISDIFNCNGLFPEILSLDVSSFYNGPVEEEPSPEPEDSELEKYKLFELVKKAESAEEDELKKREDLKVWLDGFAMNNVMQVLFEQPVLTSSINIDTIINSIFIDKGVKNIIEEYSLDIYIPEKLR